MTGLVHLYTGDGKGKTTAALGLAVRAAGRGYQVLILQFLKGRDCGELHSLAGIPGIRILRLSRDYGFTFTMTGDELASVREEHDAMLVEATSIVERGECRVLVLDEMTVALNHDLVDKDAVVTLIDTRPPDVEIVVTGRDAPEVLVMRADYVTTMQKTKHPFDLGVPAREGIEW